MFVLRKLKINFDAWRMKRAFDLLNLKVLFNYKK